MATATQKKRLVFIELHATGFRSPDIVQLAAVDLSGERAFNAYVTPTKAFEPGATRVTWLSRGADGSLSRASGSKESGLPAIRWLSSPSVASSK